MNPGQAAFGALFRKHSDPWGFRTRWYEQRKRALTLACLPRARYASAYEPGCANGELAAALAGRCDRLLCSDFVPEAVALARDRLAGWSHAHAVEAATPQQWPAGTFDLVVVSELGYYLDPAALGLLARNIRASLRADATVLACHWRHPVAGQALDGDAVHLQLQQDLGLPLLTRLVEPDLRIEVWTTDGRSVAEQEGLVDPAPTARA